jgi:hypothetical protein
MAGHCEAAWLSGQPIELSAYATIVNSLHRILQGLGLDRKARPVNEVTLEKYVAQKYGDEGEGDGN